MGLSASKDDTAWEQPSEKHQATLYYFSGRGLADQARWMMAATNVSFTQKVISQRDHLLRMSQSQLPFAQLPLLQIDGLELVQSQAIVRYLARRAGVQGLSSGKHCSLLVFLYNGVCIRTVRAPFSTYSTVALSTMWLSCSVVSLTFIYYCPCSFFSCLFPAHRRGRQV